MQKQIVQWDKQSPGIAKFKQSPNAKNQQAEAI
jgi:hypothetical protein